ncbi:MAG: hypothetical protein LUP94_02050 [Candidatus Methanomethylicus sp.]|nr:hypothetical protein [Candidatus Methanomethylicus sp.]
MTTSRPTGISILAILFGLGGLLWLFLGALITIGGGLLTFATGFLGGAVLFVGLIIVAIGLIDLYIAYGLYAGNGWAYSVAFFLTIISLIFGLLSLLTGVGLVRLLIDIIIIYYLTRPYVKAYFGRETHPQYQPPPPIPPPP